MIFSLSLPPMNMFDSKIESCNLKLIIIDPDSQSYHLYIFFFWGLITQDQLSIHTMTPTTVMNNHGIFFTSTAMEQKVQCGTVNAVHK